MVPPIIPSSTWKPSARARGLPYCPRTVRAGLRIQSRTGGQEERVSGTVRSALDWAEPAVSRQRAMRKPGGIASQGTSRVTAQELLNRISERGSVSTADDRQLLALVSQ